MRTELKIEAFFGTLFKMCLLVKLISLNGSSLLLTGPICYSLPFHDWPVLHRARFVWLLSSERKRNQSRFSRQEVLRAREEGFSRGAFS